MNARNSSNTGSSNGPAGAYGLTRAEIIRLHVILRTLEHSLYGAPTVRTGVQGVRIMRLVAMMMHGIQRQELVPTWVRGVSLYAPYRFASRGPSFSPCHWTKLDCSSLITRQPASGISTSAPFARHPSGTNTKRRALTIAAILGLVGLSVWLVDFMYRDGSLRLAAQKSPPVTVSLKASSNAGPQIAPLRADESGNPEPRVPDGALALRSNPAPAVDSPVVPAQGEQPLASESHPSDHSTRVTQKRHVATQPSESKSDRLETAAKPRRARETIAQREVTASPSRTAGARLDKNDASLDDQYRSDAKLAAMRAIQVTREPRIGGKPDEWMNNISQRRLTEIPDQFNRQGE